MCLDAAGNHAQLESLGELTHKKAYSSFASHWVSWRLVLLVSIPCKSGLLGSVVNGWNSAGGTSPQCLCRRCPLI